MSSRFCWFRPSLAGFCRETCPWPRLPSAFEIAFGPWIQRIYPEEKILLLVDSAPACTAKTTSGCWRNCDFQRIGRHMRQTWIHWTFLSHAFCRPKSRLCLTQIWPPYVRLLRKMKFELNRCQQPSTHQPLLFWPKISLHMTREPLHWKNKQCSPRLTAPLCR